MKVKSLELWHSLFHHPLVYSPLFKNYNRVALRLQNFNPSENARALVFGCGTIGAIALCLANLTPLLRVFPMLIGLVVLLVFLVITILPGLNLALKVSGAIYGEQAKGRYDLLALTMRGAPAMHWALVMRCIKDDFIARRLRELLFDFTTLLILPVVAALLTVAVIAILMILFDFYAALEFFAAVSVPILLLLTFYSDYIQSMVTAALISVVMPAYMYARTGFWLSWAAPLLFLGLQILFYSGFLLFLVYLGGWVIRPDNREAGVFLEALIGLITLFTLRELLITGLWLLALRQFEDDLRILRLD